MQIKDFLEQLSDGIKEIPKKHHSLFYAIQKLNAITQKGHFFKLKENFAIGCLDIVRDDLVFLKSFSPHHTKDFRIMGRIRGFVGGEIVLVKIRGTRAYIVSLLYLASQTQLVYLEKIKGKIVGILLKSSQKELRMIPLKARQRALNALPLHSVLEVDIRSGEILNVLGVLEDERLDEKIVLHAYGRAQEFSQDSLDLAQSFGSRVYKEVYPNRIDLSHLPFCTIDPSDAKDHDDALFFDDKTSTLYVAIADVAEYVGKGTVLDQEARKRGFSLYFPHKSIPMLPSNLSEMICSLKARELRLALVWEMKLTDEGEILDSMLYEALICSQQKLSYEEVEALLQSQTIPQNLKDLRDSFGIKEEVIESLLAFLPLAQKRKKARLTTGYDFEGKESRMILDSHMRFAKVEESKEGLSHQLIEEAMLMCNIESAKRLQALPCEGIYRIHEEMTQEKFIHLLDDLRSLGFTEEVSPKNLHRSITKIQEWAKNLGIKKKVDSMLICAQRDAQYSPQNIGHFGLGFERYTHFTSPIRRYSDLCVHRLLKEAIHQGKKLDYLSQDFSLLCKSLNVLERETSKIQMDYKDRKFAHFANQNKGICLRVSVLDERFPPICEALERIQGARIVLDSKKNYKKFDELEVVIEEVDLARAKIYAKELQKTNQSKES